MECFHKTMLGSLVERVTMPLSHTFIQALQRGPSDCTHSLEVSLYKIPKNSVQINGPTCKYDEIEKEKKYEND